MVLIVVIGAIRVGQVLVIVSVGIGRHIGQSFQGKLGHLNVPFKNAIQVQRLVHIFIKVDQCLATKSGLLHFVDHAMEKMENLI